MEESTDPDYEKILAAVVYKYCKGQQAELSPAELSLNLNLKVDHGDSALVRVSKVVPEWGSNEEAKPHEK